MYNKFCRNLLIIIIVIIFYSLLHSVDVAISNHTLKVRCSNNDDHFPVDCYITCSSGKQNEKKGLVCCCMNEDMSSTDSDLQMWISKCVLDLLLKPLLQFVQHFSVEGMLQIRLIQQHFRRCMVKRDHSVQRGGDSDSNEPVVFGPAIVFGIGTETMERTGSWNGEGGGGSDSSDRQRWRQVRLQ